MCAIDRRPVADDLLRTLGREPEGSENRAAKAAAAG